MGLATCFKVPEGVSAEQASFMELGIITLQGIRKAMIRPGDRVAVVGMGIIGQLAAATGAGRWRRTDCRRGRQPPPGRTSPDNGGVDEFVSLTEDPAKLRGAPGRHRHRGRG